MTPAKNLVFTSVICSTELSTQDTVQTLWKYIIFPKTEICYSSRCPGDTGKTKLKRWVGGKKHAVSAYG